MFPIYEAIEIRAIIPKTVGHTCPWVVLANTPGGLESFVVKLYDLESVTDNYIVTREIVSSVLAREFDLHTPSFALINIPDYLIFNHDENIQLQYENSGELPKFATIQLKDVLTATTELPSKYIRKRIAFDTLYAFDNLIKNGDRGQQKMNLLLGPNEGFLIDHEFALQQHDIRDIDINTCEIESRLTKYHLAYPYLRKLKRHNRQNLFNDFSGYLNMLNINKLIPYFQKLNDEGFPDCSQPILNYLLHIKQNSTTFVTKLKGSLQ